MNLLSSLSRRRTTMRPPSAARAASADSPAEHGAEVRDWACGWFDSSHELQRGLLVREHDPGESLGDLLPLDAWLELHLAAWRPAGPARA